MRRYFGVLLFVALGWTAADAQESVVKVTVKNEYADPAAVKIGGLLGKSITASREGRLSELPRWKDGELIKMFSPGIRDQHDKTDWYGEHAGKWMYTAAKAVRQSGDPAMKKMLLETADALVSYQAADGYLGVYSPKIRITNDAASHNRSWDVWNLTLMTMGLLEVNKYFPNPKYVNAATKIGELFLKTFGEGGQNITNYGTRYGISATILMDAVIELYKTTGDKRYLDFAELVVQRMEERENVKLVRVSLNGGDMEMVGDGKAYQLLWNLTALTKLYEVTGKEEYLKAVENAWQNISDHHLTIAGGPWGGVGKHLECFNRKNFWNPYGFIETCSTMSWIQLNKELLRITGEARFAHEIEKAAYNALIGAQLPNGRDWCYHSFSNGRRHLAHFNDCCPSSGAMALEELTPLVVSKNGSGIAVNVYTESEAEITLKGNKVKVIQKTNYPFDGTVSLTVLPSKPVEFPLLLRIPEWAARAQVLVNGKPADTGNLKPGEYTTIRRKWKSSDEVTLSFPMELQVHNKTERIGTPQGGPDMYNVSWFALSRGPLVYSATGLIGGKDRERALGVNLDELPSLIRESAPETGHQGTVYKLSTRDGIQLEFAPYFEADGRAAGTWRLTWIQNGIDQVEAVSSDPNK